MSKFQINHRKSEQGFTLVELAIVMIIIGLLITGVLKGQEMIVNAQVTSTISQMKAVEAATSTFRDSFNAFPGDIDNVAVRLPAVCQGTCLAGNGNVDGRVGFDSQPGNAVNDPEKMAFFPQLAAVDLISGVNPGALLVNPYDYVLNAEITGATLRVGYFAGGTIPTGTNSVGGAANSWRAGHYLVIGGDPNVMVGSVGGRGLTAIQATRLDNKLDDGIPAAGSVRGGGVADGANGCTNGGIYNGVDSATNCSLFYRIQG